MKPISSLILILLAAGSLLSMPVRGEDHSETSGSGGVEPAVKEIIKITESGLVPPSITLRKRDGSVFFLNSTSDSLITISIDFGARKTHCASENLKLDRATGKISSIRPIGPKDFALTCFPDAGKYKVHVTGVRNAPHGVSGTVIIE